MSNDSVLEVKNLKTHFFYDEGTVKAVKDASFEVKKGKTLGVVGESGCGKSVTSQSILRIVPVGGKIVDGTIDYYSEDGSKIRLSDLDPKGEKIRQIRGREIAMIFQEPMNAFSPVHTIGNQICEVIHVHEDVSQQEARRRAVEGLDRVGISRPDATIDEYPYQLSGGMRQRAMIAMALVCNPRLLIADEPTTALDVTIQAQILKLLQQLQDQMGMAIMFITHDLGVIAQMSDEVVVMYLGMSVSKADVDSVFYDPLHPYAEALLKSIPKTGKEIKGRLPSISGSVPGPYVSLPGCNFAPRCPKAIKGTCDSGDPPPVVELEDGRYVRCFLYE